MKKLCRYCGRKTSMPSTGPCSKSPHKNHEWIEDKAEYFCTYCGCKTKTPSSRVVCSKSPYKTHVWN